MDYVFVTREWMIGDQMEKNWKYFSPHIPDFETFKGVIDTCTEGNKVL